MNCFLFIFMITLTVATSNPVDDVSYNKIVELVNNFNSLTCKLDDDIDPNDDLTNDEIVDIVNNFNSCKDTITQIQTLISPLSTPEPTTPEPTTPEPITPVTTKLSDEDRDEITGMKEIMQKILAILADQATDEVRIAHCGVINSIEDESITASSVASNWHHYYGTQHSRLNTESGNGGWYPNPPYEGQWIELNLGKDEVVTAVATQGSWKWDAWVKTFSVSYKSSTSSIFSDVKNQYGEKQKFNGNTDMNTVVINDFTPPLTAQFIRIHPITWYRYPVLRFDLLSC